MSDPGKWFENNLTAEDLKAHKAGLEESREAGGVSRRRCVRT